ncbi:hypothetical protein [Streptomyces sp. NPDC055056]
MTGPLFVGGLADHGLDLNFIVFAAVSGGFALVIVAYGTETRERVLEEVSP